MGDEDEHYFTVMYLNLTVDKLNSQYHGVSNLLDSVLCTYFYYLGMFFLENNESLTAVPPPLHDFRLHLTYFDCNKTYVPLRFMFLIALWYAPSLRGILSVMLLLLGSVFSQKYYPHRKQIRSGLRYMNVAYQGFRNDVMFLIVSFRLLYSYPEEETIFDVIVFVLGFVFFFIGLVYKVPYDYYLFIDHRQTDTTDLPLFRETTGPDCIFRGLMWTGFFLASGHCVARAFSFMMISFFAGIALSRHRTLLAWYPDMSLRAI